MTDKSRGIRGHPSRILDGEACCRMGPGASERLSCGYPLPIVEHHEAVAIFRARRAS